MIIKFVLVFFCKGTANLAHTQENAVYKTNYNPLITNHGYRQNYFSKEIYRILTIKSSKKLRISVDDVPSLVASLLLMVG